MSDDITALLTAQSDVHGRMARSVTNLRKMGTANITLRAVEIRSTLLDQLWAKFERQHELIRAHYKEAFDQSEYNTSQFADSAENTYVQQQSLLDEYRTKLMAKEPRSASKTEGTESSGKPSLPRLKINSFSSAYEDWPTFRDLFQSIVGDNSSISAIEKFHYLKTCLEGPAEELIRPLAMTGDNYPRAWELLSRQYENKRELSRSNFSKFTIVTKMKNENEEELNRIFNAVTRVVNGQESIDRAINSHGFDLLNHLVVELFDPRTRLEWESLSSASRDVPTHEELMNFINKRALTLRAAKPKSLKVADNPSRSAKSHHVKKHTESSQCVLCKGKHHVMVCEEFKKRSAVDRKAVAETHKLCFNCLGFHAFAKCQSTRTCSTCKSRHHSMLHDAYVSPKPQEVSSMSVAHPGNDHKAILLATARVSIADRYGNRHTTRVLIDQGSEISLISEALVQRLRLPRSRSAIKVVGIGCKGAGPNRGKVTLEVTSLTTETNFNVEAFVLPRLSFYQGAQARTTEWRHVKGLQLADPDYAANDAIELLFGAEVCSMIFRGGFRGGGPQEPMAQKTLLGWILSGGRDQVTDSAQRQSFQCTADQELAELVHRFWEQEREVPAPIALTPKEQQCEDIFALQHQRTAEGRYVVRLPFASPPTTLGETRRSAERLLIAMERRCERDARFGDLYRAFLKEYEDQGHMELARELPNSGEDRCYLPHHGVLRESSTTTKLRVVFNGSQRTRSGESLNNHLLVGANLLPPLANVLLRWRWHRYALVADIEKMYRQILVHPDDQRHQCILWRHRVDEPIREFTLKTVTYGLACAPFLAIRTLRQLADDDGSRFPRGADALRRDCYVDDVVTGAHNKDDAIALQIELRNLCMAGGFSLRKWAANCRELLRDIPPEYCLTRDSRSWEQENHSTLGLRWYPTRDEFAFSVPPRTVVAFTKRSLLSETARLFDPLGWLAPVTIQAKILIQSAWLQKLEWDAPLPSTIAEKWKRLWGELPLLEELRVGRWLGTGDTSSLLELHGFADASERGYAAVVYLRITANSQTKTRLLTAKSKVAPIKPVSLPRLELCAAALLSSVLAHTRSVLNLASTPVILWSDSKVTLHWIRGHASRWKTYVANRVSLIQQRLPDAQWRHVPGKDNPADCASRGLTPRELLSHPLWWTGPAWLCGNPTQWPSVDLEPIKDVPEQRATTLAAVVRSNNEPEELLRFSSLHTLLRVTSWCLRWRHRSRSGRSENNQRLGSTLLPAEIDAALLLWIRAVQSRHYPEEMTAIKNKRDLAKSSHLRTLSPYVDEHGVMRIGGRLKHAALSFDERHPIIVPPRSWLTRLLVEAHHRRTLHGGVQMTLGLLRLRFWIPQGRAVVKRWLHQCVTCTRWKAATPQPKMGNLPPGRVTPARPFLHVGIDYAGPIFIRTSKGRGHRAHKAFIAVFVCFSSKAVHLEAVSDYTTDAFLAALRRFTARRGLCTDIYSDCGTNFSGADRQLREMLRASSPEGRKIANVATSEGIHWHFNPPSAPHFGGLWEAAVKSAKYHLRRTIGETKLTFEEMSTLLAQVEACLNSRPLHALSDDSDDLTALTPGHLLIGAPLLAIPEPSLSDKKENLLSRWQLIQRMRDHFWQRWSREYLHTLATRPKWTKDASPPRIGSLCIIRSELSPPNKWPLARITQLHPGDDGVVRVVTVKTASSELIRPLVKIVLLPEDANALISHANASNVKKSLN